MVVLIDVTRQLEPLGKTKESIDFNDSFAVVKFIHSEKVTQLCEIFTLLLNICTVVKSKVKISQNFVAFSEYMNFISKKRLKNKPWPQVPYAFESLETNQVLFWFDNQQYHNKRVYFDSFTIFSNFSCIPIIFSNLNYDYSIFLDMKNLQE